MTPQHSPLSLASRLSMHIIKRNRTYYYKLKIPIDLQRLIQVNEIRFSLRTNVKRDALLISSNYTNKYYTLFSQIRSGIYTEDEVIKLINTGLYQNLNQLNLKKVKESLPNIYTLEELSYKYSKDKVLTNAWTEKTHKAYLFVFKVFSKIIDVSKDITKISREELQEYKAILTKMPVIKPHQHNLTLNQLLKLNQNVISTSTANKYLNYIISLFKWCEVEGYVSKSVAVGLSIKEYKTKESRIPYSLDDLKILYTSSPVYTLDLDKVLSEHPERFFIPLISMYQGMRLNEVSQLYIDDIKVIDGVYCIDINRSTSDKRLKNQASVRVIPIHKELIKLGFIDYVKEQQKLNKVRLWSKLSLGLEGYGTNFRKWYGVYNRTYITKDSTKTFHSFRHLFTDTFKQISLKENIDHYAIKYLLGHSFKDDITMDVYSHGYNMKDLSNVLNKLQYKGLDLSYK